MPSHNIRFVRFQQLREAIDREILKSNIREFIRKHLRKIGPRNYFELRDKIKGRMYIKVLCWLFMFLEKEGKAEKSFGAK